MYIVYRLYYITFFSEKIHMLTRASVEGLIFIALSGAISALFYKHAELSLSLCYCRNTLHFEGAFIIACTYA